MPQTIVEQSGIDVADLLTAAASQDVTLPIPRQSLEQALQAVVTDPQSREWYLAKLKSLTRKTYRYLNTLEESNLDEILNERLCKLTDQALLEFALNPTAIMQVSNELIDSCPESWFDVYESLGDEILRREQIARPPFPFETSRPEAVLSNSLGGSTPSTAKDEGTAEQWMWREQGLEIDCVIASTDSSRFFRVSTNIDHILMSASDDAQCDVLWQDDDGNTKGSGRSEGWAADCVEIQIPEDVEAVDSDILVLRFQRGGSPGFQSLLELRLTLGNATIKGS